VVVLEIGSLLNRMADPTHVGHPFSQLNTRLAREDIVRHVAVPTGGRILLSLYECLRMCPSKITLVFLRMTLLTFLIIKKEGGHSAQEFWVRMLHTLFFDI
jgi:hypothetical protein